MARKRILKADKAKIAAASDELATWLTNELKEVMKQQMYEFDFKVALVKMCEKAVKQTGRYSPVWTIIEKQINEHLTSKEVQEQVTAKVKQILEAEGIDQLAKRFVAASFERMTETTGHGYDY